MGVGWGWGGYGHVGRDINGHVGRKEKRRFEQAYGLWLWYKDKAILPIALAYDLVVANKHFRKERFLW